MPDKNNDDDTSTIDNDDCNDDVTIPNKNIDAVVGQFKNQKNVIIILLPLPQLLILITNKDLF